MTATIYVYLVDEGTDVWLNITKPVPGSYTLALGILLQIIACVIGLMLFRYPTGSYFAILPERLWIIFVIQVAFCVGVIVALFEGRGWHKLTKSLLAVGFCVTAYWLYKGIEMIAIQTMEYVD